MSEDSRLVGDELGKPDEINQVMFFDEIEELGLELQSLVLKKRDTSPDGIWGKKNWGTTLYWDNTYTNDEVLQRVVNPFNIHIERYYDAQFYDSSTSTNVTWGTNGSLGFTSTTSGLAQSTPIHFNSENIIKATLFVEGTNTANGNYYLSSNGGSNWEEITIGTEHTFTNVGQSLMYKIDNDYTAGAGFPTAFGTWGSLAAGQTITITKLQINYEV